MSPTTKAVWPVVLSCDGVRVEYQVRKRGGRPGDSETQEEQFELWRENHLSRVFIFPAARSRETAEHAVRHELERLLNCSTVLVDTDGDAVETLFHIPRVT
jgi:hypothetical protein